MNKETLSQLSGEELVKSAPKFELPKIKLNGKEGTFYRTDKVDNNYIEKNIGKEVKGVMLKVRRVFSSYTTKESFFTNEHNSWKDEVTLFRSVEGKEGRTTKMVGSGTIGELKKAFPQLKMTQIIYFQLPNDEIVKVAIKGKGLSYLFNYWAEFENDEHIYQFETIIGIAEEESALGVYYATTFEKGDVVKDSEKVGKAIREIANKLKSIEDYYKNRANSVIEKMIEETNSTGIPTINEGEDYPEAKPNYKKIKEAFHKDEEEIDVKDIPF